MRPGRVDTVQLGGNIRRFIVAAADHTRSGAVELAQVGQGFGTVRIELNRLFKFSPRALGQPVGTDKGRPIGHFAQGAAEPQMVVRVLRIEAYGLLAFMVGGLELLQRIQHPAAQVVRLGRVVQGLGKRLEKREGLVRLAGLESGIHLGQAILQPAFAGLRPNGSCHCDAEQHGQRNSHRISFIGTPSWSGCPLVVPVATQSPSLRPERMATWVRLKLPVTTGVRLSSSFTILKT